MSEFGRLLRESRAKKKMTLREIAAEIGVTPMYISQLENEERIPMNSEVLPNLSLVLNLDPDVVMKLAFAAKQSKVIEAVNENAYLLIARKIKDASPDVLKQVNAILDGKGAVTSEVN